MFLSAKGLLGGVDKVDAASFESVWNNIKEKFHSEVSVCASSFMP